MRDWRRRRQWVGSYLLDKCAHDIDIASMITGSLADRVVSFADRSVFVPSNRELDVVDGPFHRTPGGWNAIDDTFGSDADVADHQVAMLHYGNGIKLSFHTNTSTGFPQRTWLIAGTRATMAVRLYRGRVEVRDVVSGERDVHDLPVGPFDEHFGADPAMANDLARHLFDGAPFPVSSLDALIAGLTIMAIDDSAESGEVVRCAPMWDMLRSLAPTQMAAWTGR
jgi:predicted dehydrogenase